MEKTLTELKERLQLIEELTMKNSAKWGRMNAHNLVEHLSFVFLASTGKFGKEFSGDAKKAARWKTAFFSSQYPFPKDVRMPGTKEGQAPPPLRFETMEESKTALKKIVQKYISHYKENPKDKNPHPYFGLLSYEEWVHFHTKHLEHHLMQFGILPAPNTEEIEALFLRIEEKLNLVYDHLSVTNKAKWGKMNAHQCVEHLSLTFLYSMGKFNIPFTGDLAKAKQLFEEFKKVAMPWKTVLPPAKFFSKPPPLRCQTMEESKEVLKKTFQKHKKYCLSNPTAITSHTSLGMLTTKEWLQVHPKHIEHHLVQFGVIEEPILT